MSTFARHRVLLVVLAAALPAVGAAPKSTPTPTSAVPRLTGGFGKTPAPPSKHAGPKKGLKITNESLVTEPDKGKVSTSDVKPAPTPTAPARSQRSTTPGSDEAAEPTGEGEEYWRAEARRVRERVTALREEIARLEDEVKKRESDFYSWDDGAYRDRVIKPEWDKAREQLATARQELPVAEKDLADLPDRARRAGVPAGWLRE
jgi:hypothetical protein